MDVNYEVKNVNEASELTLIENIGRKSISISKRRLFEFAKRSIDIIAGIIGTILLIPVTIGIYIAHRITNDESPIFYKQYRIGKNRKTIFDVKI